MAKDVEFFFDYGSPFSYLADTQVPDLARRTAATIIYRPMLLGAVFKATNNASPISIPAKGAYMGLELARWSKHYRVPFQMNPFFPINTLRLMRGAVASQMAAVFPAYHQAIFPAVWAEGLNVADDAVLRELLRSAGLDADALTAGIEQVEVKNRLRENTEDAVRRGAFGAPTFFVGDEMFWGNDRLDFVERALAPTA
jgi:2-hydroxychromene-2-carboxylate isomerase